MSKCPYCKVDLHIKDFFEMREYETKRGKIKTREFFKGDSYTIGGSHGVNMWPCPGCDTILGFSEYDSDRAMS